MQEWEMAYCFSLFFCGTFSRSSHVNAKVQIAGFICTIFLPLQEENLGEMGRLVIRRICCSLGLGVAVLPCGRHGRPECRDTLFGCFFPLISGGGQGYDHIATAWGRMKVSRIRGFDILHPCNCKALHGWHFCRASTVNMIRSSANTRRVWPMKNTQMMVSTR